MIYLMIGIILIIVIWNYTTNFVTIIDKEISYDDLEGLSYLHITDLHGRVKFINGRLSGLMNKLDPDFVLLTGDLTSNVHQYPKVFQELSKIKCPIYMVLGNYERENYIENGYKKVSIDLNNIINEISKTNNITLLINQAVIHAYGNNQIEIYGFDNSQYGNEAFHLEKTSVNYRILLAHSPKIIHKLQFKNIQFNHLMVGHTHGRQINLGRLIRMSYDHYHIGDKIVKKNSLFTINRGLGTTRIHVRFKSRPEIRRYQIVKCNRKT